MRLNNCPACRSPAAIRSRADSRGRFRVWVQCENCGRRTRDFTDNQEPGQDTPGGKFAVIAWNSGDYRQEAQGHDRTGKGGKTRL